MPPSRAGTSALPARMLLLLGAAVLGTLAACIGAAGRPILAPPPARGALADFPAQPEDPDVWLEARFVADHARALGADLTRQGWLPIGVRIGRRPGGAAGIYLDDRPLAAELVLQDGTVLSLVRDPRPPRADEVLLATLRRRQLAASLLPPWEEAREGFLFFRLEPDRVRIRGTRALSRVPGAERELDLNASLLGLEVQAPGGARTLYVGLRPGRWEGE